MKLLLASTALAIAITFTACTKEPTPETTTPMEDTAVSPSSPADSGAANMEHSSTHVDKNATLDQATADRTAIANKTSKAEKVDPNASNRNSEPNKAKESTTPVSPGSENPAR